MQLITALILVLAANTAFNGFPVLASILAQDRYMPRQLHTRGDRLVFSNGILLLAGFAGLLIWAFQAQSTKLIQLYIVGVFVSFTLSQAGMVRHWNRLLRPGPSPPAAARGRCGAAAISAFAFVITGTVLVIVLVTKFVARRLDRHRRDGRPCGSSCAASTAHYDAGDRRARRRRGRATTPALAGARDRAGVQDPQADAAGARVRARHPPVDARGAHGRRRPGRDRARSPRSGSGGSIPVPLKVLDSPYREITRPIIDYVQGACAAQSPRDLVTVYIPEYVVGHWWEHLLHNQSALRLKGRLLFTPGVMVMSVPVAARVVRAEGVERARRRWRRDARPLRRAEAEPSPTGPVRRRSRPRPP